MRAGSAVEAHTLRVGDALRVPGYPDARLVMAVAHLPRFDRIEVTFDTGLTVRMLPKALITLV